MMQKLLELLKDGRARTTVMLAIELDTTPEDIQRKLEYMEHMGIIRKVAAVSPSGSGCAGCHQSAKSGCESCMPKAELFNMGEMWEVVQ